MAAALPLVETGSLLFVPSTGNAQNDLSIAVNLNEKKYVYIIGNILVFNITKNIIII